MSDYKYTTDGKKVIVLGQLNSAETIVQEIFISDGNEFPGGENFIVKSLLDKPAESWKAKNLRELEERFDRQSRECKDSLNQLHRNFNHEKQNINAFIKNLKQTQKVSDSESFKTLSMFLSGEITHLVYMGYNYKIVDFMSAISSDKNETYDQELKLLSLFGRSNGDLSWSIGQYSDHSGSFKRAIPCASFVQAKNVLCSYINDKIVKTGSINEEMIKVKKQYDLKVITIDQANEYYKKRIENLDKTIAANHKINEDNLKRKKEYSDLIVESE
jgi:hypothetical protein